jgi:hypothetical protein
LAGVLALLAAPPAFADLFVGPNCQFKTIQAAIDAVQPGFNIGVVPGTYYELLHVNSKKDLLIFGGWTTGCGAGSSGPTIVSGAHNSGDSVVTTSGENYLTLADLTISDGNENSDGGHGGGIDFGGHGALYLDAVVLGFRRLRRHRCHAGWATEVQLYSNTIIEATAPAAMAAASHRWTHTPVHRQVADADFPQRAQRNSSGIDIGPARAVSAGSRFPGLCPLLPEHGAERRRHIGANTETTSRRSCAATDAQARGNPR